MEMGGVGVGVGGVGRPRVISSARRAASQDRLGSGPGTGCPSLLPNSPRVCGPELFFSSTSSGVGVIGEALLHQIFRKVINTSSFSKHGHPTQA